MVITHSGLIAILAFKILGRNDLKIQLDHVWTMFCQCKGQKGDKGEATWPRALLRPQIAIQQRATILRVNF